MIREKEETRHEVQIVNIDDMVPEDHLVRKIEKAIDFSFIYELVRNLYCKDNGRPSVDPVVLVKIVLIQHLFGIRSMRQTVKEIEVNVAYRWFLHMGLSAKVPHFATVSYNFRNRFTAELIDEIFERILAAAIHQGFVDAEAIFVDATHFKAAVNTKRKQKAVAEKTAKIYREQLLKEVNEDRVRHGKKELKEEDKDDDDTTGGGETHEVTKSPTDPDAGIFRKGEHKVVFAYLAHTACDKNGFVLGTSITAGNVHDSIPFDGLYDDVMARFPEATYISADAAYKTPWICKKIFDDGRIFSTAYKAPSGKKGFFRPYEYVYDEHFNCVLCPENQVLKYVTTNREGKRQFKSDPEICASCPSLQQCTHSRDHCKVVEKHLWAEYLERAEDVRHSDVGKWIYSLRKETIERVFADGKEKHGMRYTQHRGLPAVTGWVKLKYAAMNLKKLASWMWKEAPKPLYEQVFQFLKNLVDVFYRFERKKNPVAFIV